MKKIHYFVVLAFVAIIGMGQVYIRSETTDFDCSILSTATTLTAVTGCEALATGQKRYITGLQWYSSIISTTANFMTITIGTGTNCATSARNIYNGYAQVAFSGREVVFSSPIVTDANDGICFVHASAGTRHVNIQGYLK